MKFLHAADIHLDSPLTGLERYEGAPIHTIRNATRHAFDNLIELALNEQIAFLLLAGDLYDGDWRDYNTGLYFNDRMNRLRDAGIKVFIVAGNHDAASQITKHLRLPDNVTLFSTKQPERKILDTYDTAIHGQGFATRAVTNDLSQAYPQGDPYLFNIGLLHTSLDGKPGHEPYAPCHIDGLRSKGYHYWALGHIHQREVISQAPWILYPGNLQGRHIREQGAKGCTLVTVKAGEIIDVCHHDLDQIRWSQCDLKVATNATIDDLYDQINSALQQQAASADGRPLALRLVLHGTCHAHAELQTHHEQWIQEYRALASSISGAEIWLERVQLKTAPQRQSIDHDPTITDLLNAIDHLQPDETTFDRINSELTALRQKLPAELLSGTDPFDPTDPKRLATTLTEIKEIIRYQLLKL